MRDNRSNHHTTHTGNACCLGSIKANRLLSELNGMTREGMFFWQTVREFNEAAKQCKALREHEDYKALRRLLLLTSKRQKAELRARGLGKSQRARHALAA
jgi:hypothetical protein